MMKNVLRLTILPLVLSFMAPVLYSAEQASDPAGLLQKLEGRWRLTYTVKTEPGAAPQTGSGIETHRFIAASTWKLTEFEGELFGAPYASIGLTGYDADKGKYVQYYFDASAPHAQPSEGAWDEKTKTLVRWSDGLDFAGNPARWKQVLRFPDANTYLLDMYTVDEAGHETLAITCRAERLE